MSTNLIIKDRGTGKSAQLLYTSATTQYPILTKTKDRAVNLLKMAEDLDLCIPVPLTENDIKSRGIRLPENILVDEGYDLIGTALNYYLGTHVVAVTLSDKLKERYDKKLSKAYLEGRYGAIPVFRQFSFQKGE